MLQIQKLVLIGSVLTLTAVNAKIFHNVNFGVIGKNDTQEDAHRQKQKDEWIKKRQEIDTDVPRDFFLNKEIAWSTKFRFAANVSSHAWNGFVDGWYSKSKNKFDCDDDCFGTWIEEDFNEIQDLAQKSFHITSILDVTFEEFQDVFGDIFELLFKQDEVCGFRRVLKDTVAFCSQKGHCDIDKTLTNLEKHAFEIITKLSGLMDLGSKIKDVKKYDEIFDSADEIGESFGVILASLINFSV
ncbi:UNKNOWN [Stylonychia lemnae]|uniref:Secreted protein n=1 Tax=Stylonychia lemnae TaxID=5949 RepID=A0A078AVM9_STYLE|nr:UNKNOWN [Stylonychia lemnae]|eukprot:CDW86435.1 UNKNOWN [Stylonychia lemnae]